MSIQTRIIIASIISFAFFIAYDAYSYKNNSKEDISHAKAANTVQKIDNSANSTNTAPKPILDKTETKTVAAQAPIDKISNDKILATIKTKHSILKIDTLGRVATATLTDKFFKDKEGVAIEMFSALRVKPLEIRFSDPKLNTEAFSKDYSVSNNEIDVSKTPQSLVLTQKLSSLTLIKKITFYPDGHYDIKVTTSAPAEYYITPGFRPDVMVDRMAGHGVLIQQFDKTTEIIEDGDATGFESFRDATLVTAFDRYYATIFYGREFNVRINKVGEDEPLLFTKGSSDFSFKGYIGSKDHDRLRSIDPNLVNIIEYGIFTFMAAPMYNVLNWLVDLVGGNWGWAIMLFTILVRVLLFPLSAKGMISMNKLKELSPKIKEIQAKYKGDNQKVQMHMMDLYKKHGANPMGGCLPLILQIPIFFSIYRVLINAIELKGSEWLYISDLSLMDPYYILPIIMGATMFLQQKVTPSNITDPLQEKMFKFLPLIFTFFFLTFPAGLVVYWIVNNTLSILQQYIINIYLQKKKAEHR